MQTSISEKLALIGRFEETLREAAKQRHRRPGSVVIGGCTEPGWVVYERETMLAGVNRERSARGLTPVTLKDIEKAERLAIGHSDYGYKYALYCTEFAVGEAP